MKKTPARPTDAENLEAKFDRGEDVLDYFDPAKARITLPRSRAGTSYIIQSAAEEQVVVQEDPGAYLAKDFRKGAVKRRTQVKSPRAGGHAKRNESKGGKPFKGAAKEVDRRRK